MSWDELEPGQDDLVQDGMRRRKKSKASPPPAPKIPGGSPVKAGILDRFKGFLEEMRQTWNESYRNTQVKQYQRQQARRQKKGK